MILWNKNKHTKNYLNKLLNKLTCHMCKARKKSVLTIAYKRDIIKKWIKKREDIMKIWYIREIFGN